MLRVARLTGWLAIALAPVVHGAAAQKPFIECNREELLHAVPELAGVQFDVSQDRLDGLLRTAGEKLANMFAVLADVSAAEEINELRFGKDLAGTNRREGF